MIEEITSIGFEVVGVESPSAIRNGYTELMFFVALTLKRDETAIVGSAEIKQRTGNGNQRWRLIIVAVKGAEGPVEVRNVQSDTEARADRGLSKSSGKVGWPHACGKHQPGSGFEFVIQGVSYDAARRMLRVGDWRRVWRHAI